MHKSRFHRIVVIFLVASLVLTMSGLSTAFAVEHTADTAPFDPAQFGRVLTEEELDEVEGEAALSILAGAGVSAAIGVGVYTYYNGWDPGDEEWRKGAAKAAAAATIPLSGSVVASAAGIGGAAMGLYSAAVTFVTSAGPYWAEGAD